MKKQVKTLTLLLALAVCFSLSAVFADSTDILIFPAPSKTFSEMENSEKCDALIENITRAYTETTDEWFVLDLMLKDKYAGNGPSLSTNAKSAYLKSTVDKLALGRAYTSELAKAVVIMNSLGIDPTSLTSSENRTFSTVSMLISAEHSDQYSAPWELLALSQFESLTDEKIKSLISVMLSAQNKDGVWGYEWNGVFYEDIDTAAAIITSLAPYYTNKNSEYYTLVKDAIDKALAYISTSQQNDGNIGEYTNANTSAMTLIALLALGIDVDTDERFIKNGNSLIDGLLSFAAEDGLYFTYYGAPNELATEQSFRALIAYKAFKNGENISTFYDFSEKASISYSAFTPAVFTDISNNDSAYESVQLLAASGVINGRAEGKFYPEEFITRAEFITMLFRICKGSYTCATAPFSDISNTAWFTAAVNWAYENGIAFGFDSQFMPDQVITKEEAGLFVKRSIEKALLINNDTDEAVVGRSEILKRAEAAIMAAKLSAAG